MSVFQLLTLPFIALMFLVSARSLFRTPSRPLVSLAWMALWLTAMVAVIYPNSTTQFAQLLGIRRGADLLIYTAVLAAIVAFYTVSLRLRRMSREITLLTRELALLDAERKSERPPGPAA